MVYQSALSRNMIMDVDLRIYVVQLSEVDEINISDRDSIER